MTRTPFISGNYYHIKNSANNQENLFYEDENYWHFLRLFEVHVAPVAELVAYCLLNDRFELLIRIKPESEIPEKFQMKTYLPLSHMFNAYTKGMNSRYGRRGSLFRDHFTREKVQLSDLTRMLAGMRLLQKSHPDSKVVTKVPAFVLERKTKTDRDAGFASK
ncbi:transposase [Flavobacterium sp.]|uniref:transposase n=1 Tax=Flavobacterium sp. TaxID=239 RepID=UPI00122BF87A|nr:transposase [Flavobacterium sp.]RZJ71185.1 MAG: transposase [Flavobacterium sp.]